MKQKDFKKSELKKESQDFTWIDLKLINKNETMSTFYDF